MNLQKGIKVDFISMKMQFMTNTKIFVAKIFTILRQGSARVMSLLHVNSLW